MFIQVVLDVPASINPSGLYDYEWVETDDKPNPRRGDWVVVPFGQTGKNLKLALVLQTNITTQFDPQRIKAVVRIATEVPPVDTAWLNLLEFTASYYQRSLGEVSGSVLPPHLRQKAIKAAIKPPRKKTTRLSSAVDTSFQGEPPKQLTDQQHQVLEKLLELTNVTDQTHHQEKLKPHVLFGITGSGKTEVYLQWIAHLLEKKPSAQTLVLVPEIALTPQLAQRFTNRFGDQSVVVLHSEKAQAARAKDWIKAAGGEARIILGTRSAIFTVLPFLSLIIVDEEHDPSFKQQEGIRYHARDLAIVRANQLNVPILLGSATPSLETWHNIKQHKFVCVELTHRAHQQAKPPTVYILPLSTQDQQRLLMSPIVQAVQSRLERKEQTIFFLNRRGFAPALYCDQCRWVMPCEACTNTMVWHKTDKKMHCHQCGLIRQPPPQCPSCGNSFLSLIGQGTQRLEDHISQLFPNANTQRLDADLTPQQRLTVLDSMKNGEIDLLIGTQMIAKGHDFSQVSLVVVVDADQALYSQDFRASERLYATLLQVSGRAGRAEKAGEVMVQTRFPDHSLFTYLQKQDTAAFLNQTLKERQQLSLPPFQYWAILRFEHKQAEKLQQWLASWLEKFREQLQPNQVVFHEPTAAIMAKKAHSHRWQLLIESTTRSQLQNTLKTLRQYLLSVKSPVYWVIDVDPQEI
jgi:primosomal protein N' (replication factor Y)